MKNYDILIVGAGIGGLTAAIYASRANKKVGVIEKNIVGGQILSTNDIENYPGFDTVSGYELMEKIQKQAERLKVDIIYDNVISYDLKNKEKKITAINEVYESKAVILAMGASSKKLGLKNEDELIGSGISYCGTCDGAFFKNKDVMVVGSGATAISDAIYLSPIAKKVYIVSRENITDFKESNIEKIENANVAELIGNPLKSVRLSTNDNKEKIIDVNGLFVAVGYAPASFGLDNFVEKDEKGYIITNDDMQTMTEGVYAVGDIRKKKLRQLVTAASDGAIAANAAAKYISLKFNKNLK